jgi:predicted P-loop ATPase/GTPase
VYGLPEEVIAGVGRVTIAAGDLELVLALIGAAEVDGDAFKILAKPGEPLRAARRAVEVAVPVYRDAFQSAVERAAQLLARRHTVVHAMWVNDDPGQGWELLHYKTYIRHPADRQTLDNLARELMDVRNQLVRIVTAQINNHPAPTIP